MALLLVLAAPGWAETVSYREGEWNSTNKVVDFTTKEANATKVESDTTAWTGTANEPGWYYVPAGEQPVIITDRVTVSGTVNLILCDGATLKAEKGITVATGNTLNIYGQIAGTGQLEATGGNTDAGIGGGDVYEGGGTVTVYGGVVTATSQYAAGIGGGRGGGNGDPVTVYGGTVTAISNSSAGIGGGYQSNGGPVTVYGGTVTAKGGGGAAGIGGGFGSGFGGNGGEVTIYGGTVTATGGNRAQGIGGGVNNDGVLGAPGTLTVGTGVAVYGSDTANTMIPLNPDDEGKIIDRPQYMIAVGPVAYRYTEDNGVTWKNGSAENATLVTGGTTTWSSNNWYFVAGNVTITTRITVNGTVNLILCDNATLTASAGITTTGATLNIYAQSEGDNMGQLVATGGDNEGTGGAGIGGIFTTQEDDDQKNGGTVEIHGGRVTATGGDNDGNGSAGIGGGCCKDGESGGGAGGTVTIYGGTIEATGQSGGAGIGGGQRSWDGGWVTIYGGTVTATGSKGGAGIGGGDGGDGGEVIINGGTVKATGDDDGAGIGGGEGGDGGPRADSA